MIFDSGPYFASPQQIVTYFHGLLPLKGRIMKATGGSKLLEIMVHRYWINEGAPVGLHYAQENEKFKESISDMTPKLLLNNRSDHFIRFDDMDKWIQGLDERGAPYHEELFAKSEHVQHYRVHPEQYEAALFDFLIPFDANKKC
eukprot:Rmarinus@m.1581